MSKERVYLWRSKISLSRLAGEWGMLGLSSIDLVHTFYCAFCIYFLCIHILHIHFVNVKSPGA